MTIKWMSYPRSTEVSDTGRKIIEIFESALPAIGSDHANLKSNEVLSVISKELESSNFKVEGADPISPKINIPVLYGENGKIEKSYDVDAYNADEQYRIEVEAGAGVSNNRFLVDLIKACTLPNIDNVCIAVRQDYKGAKDFKRVNSVIESIYVSDRLNLPLTEVLILGY